MSTTPPKRRPPARKTRAAERPEAAPDAVVDPAVVAEADQAADSPTSLIAADQDGALDDVFQALMAEDDEAVVVAPVVQAPVEETPVEAPAKPARKRASRAKVKADVVDVVEIADPVETTTVAALPAAEAAGGTEAAEAAPAPRAESPRKRATRLRMEAAAAAVLASVGLEATEDADGRQPPLTSARRLRSSPSPKRPWTSRPSRAASRGRPRRLKLTSTPRARARRMPRR